MSATPVRVVVLPDATQTSEKVGQAGRAKDVSTPNSNWKAKTSLTSSTTTDGDCVERDLVLVHPLGGRLHIGKVDKTERARATCSDSTIRAGHTHIHRYSYSIQDKQ